MIFYMFPKTFSMKVNKTYQQTKYTNNMFFGSNNNIFFPSKKDGRADLQSYIIIN